MADPPDNEEEHILGTGRDTMTRSFSLADAFCIGYLLESLSYLVDNEAPLYEYSGIDEGTISIMEIFNEIATILSETDISSSIKRDIQNEGIDIATSYSRSEDNDLITLQSEDQRQLYDAVTTWKRVFEEELEAEKRIAISDSLLDIEALIDNPSALFDEQQTWNSLSDTTQSDLTEACRALACQCPTSSVFMSLRAVEECLRQWYRSQTGREIEQRSFGEVLGELDDQYDGDDVDRPAVLSNLDYLNERRNQVSHPERLPDIEEAETTIMNVRGTISDIYDEINSS